MVLIEKLLEKEEKGLELSSKIASLCRLYHLPIDYSCDKSQLSEIIESDKKRQSDEITIVLAKEIGKAYLKKIKVSDLKTGLLNL